MAAAQALLSAAGLVKPNTKLLKKSTATERATSTSKSTATERATSSTDDVSLLPLTGLPMSTSKLQASAAEDSEMIGEDCRTAGDNDLEKIVALLLWMAQDFQSNIHIDDIHHAALDLIITSNLGSLHTASAAKLSMLIDIMMLQKDGSAKDPNATLTFMRLLAKIREEVRATSSDNATERVELDRDEVSLCFRRLGRILLTEDLLPHQKRDNRYCLRNNFEGDTHLSGFQRSFTDSLLRKVLGDKRVAFVIWQHGIPSIADVPMVYDGRLKLKFLDMGMLQSGLDECLQWYIGLANDIVLHHTQEGYDAHLSASSLDPQEVQRQQTRREALQEARDAMRLGATLAQQRDDRKRSYDDMNDAEQKTLEDYETGRIKRAKQRFTTPGMKPFRSKLSKQL